MALANFSMLTTMLFEVFSTDVAMLLAKSAPGIFGGGPDSGIKDPAMLAAFGWNVLAWLAWGLLILLGLDCMLCSRTTTRTIADSAECSRS